MFYLFYLFKGLIEQKANLLLQHYSRVRQLLQAPPSAKGATRTPFGASGAHTAGMEDFDLEDPHGPGGEMSANLVSVLGTGPKVPMGQDLLRVNPPKSEDYRSDESDGDDDGDTRPLTRDELKQRTLNKLTKKMGGGLAMLNMSGANNTNTNTNTGNTNTQGGGALNGTNGTAGPNNANTDGPSPKKAPRKK